VEFYGEKSTYAKRRHSTYGSEFYASVRAIHDWQYHLA